MIISDYVTQIDSVIRTNRIKLIIFFIYFNEYSIKYELQNSS